MESEKLTAAVLGLNDSGQRLLKAAAATGCLQIKAVADQDPAKAERAAAEYHCAAYSDYRQLIVQNQLDCLLVAAETHTCDEQLKAALKKKFHVLKTAPLARTFEEARESVRLADSFMAMHEMLAQGRLEQVFLISASCSFSAADRSSWRDDPKLAGGGVLLHDCYQLFDQLLLSFPLPEQVYALKTNQAPDKQQRLYLTEDTALVCLRFSDALMGSVVATRRNEIGPHQIRIEVHAKEARLTVTGSQVELKTREGRNDLKWRYDEEEQVATERLLSSFARSLQAPEQFPLVSSGAENLRTMAVLESAYLSARTGFPEEPARILQLAGPPPHAGTGV
jgi:predicted dehydrogenase